MKNLSRSQMERAFHTCPDQPEVYAEQVHSRRRFLSQLGGAGLGGLPWRDVRQLIEREFHDEHEIEITVCTPR